MKDTDKRKMSNDTHSSLDDIFHVGASVSIFCNVILVLEVVVGTVVNVLLCAAVYHKKSLRTPVNALVVNLSVAGLLVSTVCAPMMLAVVAKPMGERKWPTEACLAPHVLWEFVSTVQLVSLVCISLERLQAIAKPFDRLQRAHRIRFYIAFSWIVGAVNIIISHQMFWISPILYECRTHLRLEEFRYPYGFYVLVPFIIISVVVIVASYIGIAVLLRKNARVREAKMRDDKVRDAEMREKRSHGKSVFPADAEGIHNKSLNEVDDALQPTQSPVTAEEDGVTAHAPIKPLPSTLEAAGSDVSESSVVENTADFRHLADLLLYMKQQEHPPAKRNHSFVRVARGARHMLRRHYATVKPVQPVTDSTTRNGLQQSAGDRREGYNGVHRGDILSAVALHNLTAPSRENGRDHNLKDKGSAHMIVDKYVTPESHNNDPRHCMMGDARATGKTQGVVETKHGRLVRDYAGGDRTYSNNLADSAKVCASPFVVGSPVTATNSRTTTLENSSVTPPTNTNDPNAIQTACSSIASQPNQLVYSTSASLKPTNLSPHPVAPSPGTSGDPRTCNNTISVIEIHDVDGLTMRVRNKRPGVVGSICVMSGGNRERGRRRIEAKTARTTLIVIVAFLLAWCPLTVAIFTLQLRSTTDTSSVQHQHNLYMASLCIAMLATALNPLTYGLITYQFRAELNRVKGKISKICAKKL